MTVSKKKTFVENRFFFVRGDCSTARVQENGGKKNNIKKNSQKSSSDSRATADALDYPPDHGAYSHTRQSQRRTRRVWRPRPTMPYFVLKVISLLQNTALRIIIIIIIIFIVRTHVLCV
jgi:hypothetical protein